VTARLARSTAIAVALIGSGSVTAASRSMGVDCSGDFLSIELPGSAATGERRRRFVPDRRRGRDAPP
jgi:hypothetical protein